MTRDLAIVVGVSDHHGMASEGQLQVQMRYDMELLEPKTKEPGDKPGSFLQRSFISVLQKPVNKPGHDQSHSYWTMTVRFIFRWTLQ